LDRPARDRRASAERRCVVVADGLYEWQQMGRRKQPVYIALKSREPFAFAGLWESWMSPEGEEVKSCTIITTEANQLLKPIHDRMPVILIREAEAVWLDPAIQEPGALLSLLKPYPADEMEWYPVSTRVNNPAHDGKECIVPLS